MYTALYYKSKYKLGQFNNYIKKIQEDLNLKTIEIQKKSAVFENAEMIISINKKIIEILVYDEKTEYVKKLDNYFK